MIVLESVAVAIIGATFVTRAIREASFVTTAAGSKVPSSTFIDLGDSHCTSESFSLYGHNRC